MRSVCRLAGGTARHGTARRGVLGRGGRREGDIGRRGGVCVCVVGEPRRCDVATLQSTALVSNSRRGVLLVVTSELNRWDPPEEVGRHGGTAASRGSRAGSWRDDMRYSPCADGARGPVASERILGEAFVILYERASE